MLTPRVCTSAPQYSPLLVHLSMNIDESTLKFLFEQNLSTIKSFVEIISNNFHQELKGLKDENVELRRSLEFTQNEVADLKSEIAQLKTSSDRNSDFQPNFNGLAERVRCLEDGARVKNLRITGLSEQPNENSEQTQHKVEKLISEKLQLENVEISSAFRVGRNSEVSNSPRPIVAEISSVRTKISCLKASNRLKGSNIYVSEDVSKATQEIRRQKAHILKQKRDEGYIAYFSGTEIITKSKRNSAQNVNPHGLNSSNELSVSPPSDHSGSTNASGPTHHSGSTSASGPTHHSGSTNASGSTSASGSNNSSGSSRQSNSKPVIDPRRSDRKTTKQK